MGVLKIYKNILCYYYGNIQVNLTLKDNINKIEITFETVKTYQKEANNENY